MLAVVRLTRPGTVRRISNTIFRSSQKLNRRSLVVPPYAIRGISTEIDNIDNSKLDWIDVAPKLAEGAEPSFASLGLGKWTPPGLIESALEYLHISHGVPWWGTIVISTLCIRIIIFPMVIYTRRYMIEFNKVLPQMTHLQDKFTKARKSGDRIEAERYALELTTFIKEKNVNPLKNMIGPMASMPFFISFFMALREMSGLPVESMRNGGLFWFTDLTTPDQFYALPVLTCATMWLTIKVGADTGKITAPNAQTILKVMQFMPLITLPFISQFPAALLCYWVTTNAFSLIQAGFLSITDVQKWFKIYSPPSSIQFQNASIKKSKGFLADFKESWENINMSHQVDERRQIDLLKKKASPNMSHIQAKSHVDAKKSK